MIRKKNVKAGGNSTSNIVVEGTNKASSFIRVVNLIGKIALPIIGLSYAYGQFTEGNKNDLKELQTQVEVLNKKFDSQTKDVKDLLFVVVENDKKIYDRFYDEFTKMQNYNKVQFELIVDFGNTNNALLKRILEANQIEKNQQIFNDVEKFKNDIITTPQVKSEPKRNPNLMVIAGSRNDSTFYAKKLTTKDVEIIKNKYKIKDIKSNSENQNLFDVIYCNFK